MYARNNFRIQSIGEKKRKLKRKKGRTENIDSQTLQRLSLKKTHGNRELSLLSEKKKIVEKQNKANKRTITCLLKFDGCAV